jgi:hypothetical protein
MTRIPGGVVGEHNGGEQPGQLGHRRRLARVAVDIDRRRPGGLGQGGDRGVLALGQRPADREFSMHALCAQAADVGRQRLRGAGAGEADQYWIAVPVLVGDLRQRGIEHRDVVGGGVGSGVARPQHSGQRLVGVVAEVQHGVVAEGVLVLCTTRSNLWVVADCLMLVLVCR